MEDGAALGTVLASLASKDALPARLHTYQEVRNKRAAAMQIFSNAGQEEAEKIQEDAKKYVNGPIPRKRITQVKQPSCKADISQKIKQISTSITSLMM